MKFFAAFFGLTLAIAMLCIAVFNFYLVYGPVTAWPLPLFVISILLGIGISIIVFLKAT